MSKASIFNKKPASYQELIKKLQVRGLLFNAPESASKRLKNISYYRLLGYGLAFEQRDTNGKRIYQPNTYFETIISICNVDSKIRILLLSAIEHIEVAIRSIINHELSCKYDDAHWYLQDILFKETTRFSHKNLIKEVNRHTAKNANAGSEKELRREVFIHHYYSQYDELEYPPCCPPI